jgi:Carboxypeptidase regulatory-like domain
MPVTKVHALPVLVVHFRNPSRRPISQTSATTFLYTCNQVVLEWERCPIVELAPCPPLLRLLRLCAASSLLLVFLPPHHVFAQDGSSALNGVVEDITGARVASAAVVVANPENGFHREAVADAAGNFIFGMLQPGRYIVSAWTNGMQPQPALRLNSMSAEPSRCNCGSPPSDVPRRSR